MWTSHDLKFKHGDACDNDGIMNVRAGCLSIYSCVPCVCWQSLPADVLDVYCRTFYILDMNHICLATANLSAEFRPINEARIM